MPLTATPYSGPNNNLNVNLTISQGEDGDQALTLSVGGVPMNLTGYNAKMLIAFPQPLLLEVSNSMLTIPTPTDGTVVINLTAAQTEAFVPGSYSYDLFIMSTDLTTCIRAIAGLFIVLASETPIP